MLSWHFLSSTTYKAASDTEKSEDKLYFLSDTHEIYRGTQSFSESVLVVDDFPAAGAVGKLYVHSSTLEGKIWNGTTWTTVIQPVQAALTTTDTALPVSGKAVSDYVTGEIAKVTGSKELVTNVAYTEATNKLTVSKADGSSSDIELTNVAVDLEYDAKTGKLNVKNAAGTVIGTGISLDLERFVSEATYDHESRTITLKFNDDSTPLTINVGDLVDTYTAKNSTTVALTVTGNEFTAEAIVSAAEGNTLVKTEQGLYVAATDISGKVDKVTSATENNIATFTADGNIKDSTTSIGGATLAAAPSASVLATEKAVDAIRTALQTAINGKIDLVATGKADEVLTATATGGAQVSGVKIGRAALKDTTDAATLATEKAVETYVTGYAVAKTSIVTNGNVAATVTAASDEKVASEKAFVDAMTWKTTI